MVHSLYVSLLLKDVNLQYESVTIYQTVYPCENIRFLIGCSIVLNRYEKRSK